MYRMILIGIVVAVACVGGGWVIYHHPYHRPQSPIATTTNPAPLHVAATSTTYLNPTYGYAVTYPITLQRQEYPDGSIALGQASTTHFIVLNNVRVAMSGASSSYPDFESFAIANSRNQCAADGPMSSIRCTKVLDLNPYTTKTGLTGVTFSLDRVHDVFASGTAKIATSTHSAFGPFYVFNIGANTGTTSARYTALVVQPSPSLGPQQLDATLTKTVADSLTLTKVGP